MDPERWVRVQSIFHQVADLDADERRAALARLAAGDDDLAARVAALLDADARAQVLLDRDVGQIAFEVLAAPGDDLPVDRVGDYTLVRRLGEGGMGVVYLAERAGVGGFAAIKLLRDAALSPARRERFASEQRTLARLTHRSIARLYEADTLPDGTPWFAMEYVEGLSLDDYCRAHGTPLAERLRLFREVCDAVQAAHQQLVIHRDIKPSNILVGSGGDVKLLDFGIAKQLESLEGPGAPTRTMLRLMTPAYAAPEQVLGEPAGVQTDVYALGVVLYELIAGRPPYDLSNLTPREAESLIVEREPERPSAAGRHARERGIAASPSAWADLDVLCLTAMHKDRERRYASVEALARDVDHFRRGEPLEARADALGYRVAKFVRRHWRPLAAACVALGIVASLVVFYTLRLAAARDAAVAEAARTQRIQGFMLNLFDAGDAYEGPPADQKVVTLIERGIQAAHSLERDPGVQAELQHTLGSVSQRLGDYTRADQLLEAALAWRRRSLAPDHPDTLQSLVSLGLLRRAEARLDEAHALVRDAYDRSRVALPREHPVVAQATLALGQVLEARAAYDEAVPILEEAVALYTRPGPESPDLAAALSALANTHYYAGRHEEADRLNRRVLAISRRLYGERHPSVAHDLINLGATEYARGNFVSTETYRRQAFDILRAWYGDDHPETASAMTLLSQPLVNQGRLDEAVALIRKALPIQERTYGEAHPRVALAWSSLGSVTLMKGDHDAAEAAFRRALAIFERVHGDGRHSRIGITHANIASVDLARQAFAAAAAGFRRALDELARAGVADGADAGIARVKLGRALLGQRKFVEAETALLAGYQTLAEKMQPSVSWLQSARSDLAAVYDALNQPDRARHYRDEHARHAAPAPS